MDNEPARSNSERSDAVFASRLGGFGPVGLLAILLIIISGNITVGDRMFVLPIGALLVLVWVYLSRTSWRAIGYVRPRSWILSTIAGIVIGFTLKLMMKAIVMPLLGADPINQAYHFLAGNRALLPTAVWAMLVAGFGEETVFRGFMFERLGKLLGRSCAAKVAIVAITSIWFGLAHYYNQGLAGVEQAMITGLTFGAIFAATGRIWMLMIAHATFDLTALAMIYWNLETRVAHLVFK